MNSIRVWSIVTIVAMVAVVAGGWFLGVAPRLSDVSAANLERTSVQTLNAAQEARLAELEQLSGDQAALERELAELRRALPADAALPDLVGQLSAIAGGTGAQLAGFTASEPAVFEAQAVGADGQPTAGQPPTGQPSTGQPAPQPGAAGAPGAPVVPGAGQPAVGQAVPQASGFLSIPVSVQATGTHAQVLQFVHDLQYGERLFLATGLVISIDETGLADASIDGLVYVMQAPDAGVAPVSAPVR